MGQCSTRWPHGRRRRGQFLALCHHGRSCARATLHAMPSPACTLPAALRSFGVVLWELWTGLEPYAGVLAGTRAHERSMHSMPLCMRLPWA